MRRHWCNRNFSTTVGLSRLLLLPGTDPSRAVTCQKYAQAVHHFISAGPSHGAQIDFRKRNLVGIGHSLGANAMWALLSMTRSLILSVLTNLLRLLLQHLKPIMPFSSIIIVEPMISPAGPQHLKKLRSMLVKGAYERRDVWPDLEQAMSALKKRDRTKGWDPRVLDLFVVCTFCSGTLRMSFWGGK